MGQWSRCAGLLAMTAGLLGGGAARAEFINGGFDAGFTGWLTTGNTAVIGNLGTIAPPQGTTQALLRTDGGSAAPGTVATFLGTTVAALQAANGGGTLFNGSAIRQNGVTINAGESFAFEWDFLTSEFTPPTTFNDAAFLVAVQPVGGPVTLLANVNTSAFEPVSVAGFNRHTGYGTFVSAPFASTTTINVGVAVFNVGDNLFVSGLLVDNFRVIPEPTSLALLGVGAVGMLGYRWRQRKPSPAA